MNHTRNRGWYGVKGAMKRHPPVTLTCEICGSEFQCEYCRRDEARFCGRKCHGIHHGRTYVGENATAWKGGITHDSRGYLQVSAGKDAKKRLHVLRAEKALGHPLPKGAVVHHVDGDVGNPNARLVICQDQAYHLLLHRRARELQRRKECSNQSESVL